MSYQSEYTGDQMEKVFSRVTNIVTGSVTFTATGSADTDTYTYTKNNITGHKNINYKVFVNLHMITVPLIPAFIASYAAQNDSLTVSFRDLYPGFSYTFDYLLIE